MNEHRWIRVTAVKNIPLREGRAVRLGDREIALFNLGPSTPLGTGPSTPFGTGPAIEPGDGDRVLATDNQCPHQGGPLCDGIVTGDSVVCPLHAWRVNLASGCVERPVPGKDHCVTTYPTRIDDDGVVSVDLGRVRSAEPGLRQHEGSAEPGPRQSEGVVGRDPRREQVVGRDPRREQVVGRDPRSGPAGSEKQGAAA